jgi:magnesium chelatase family protein
LDRIDLHIEVPTLSYKELNQMTASESAASDSNGSNDPARPECLPGTDSRSMRRQVELARARQTRRFAGLPNSTNALMSSRQIRQMCKLSPACSQLLEASVHDLGLSARAHDKVLRVARTIADVDGTGLNGADGHDAGAHDAGEIQLEHIQEAVNYRMLDRQLWS